MLRALGPEGPDDLFVTGDPHQRICDAQVFLRSHRRRGPQRTAARRLPLHRGDPALGPLTARQRTGRRPDRRRPRHPHRLPLPAARRQPVCEGHCSENEEAHAVVRQVRGWMDAGVAPSDIAVCARFNTLTGNLADRIAAAGVPVVRVRDGEPDGAVGVRVSTLHSMKGLECRCVAVAGATAKAFPFPPAVTPADVDGIQHATGLTAERCLLFVACTRAPEALYVSYGRRPSAFLDGAS
ncbi:3'-5' exonuclease [Streptomyces sp. NPDC002206]